MARYSRVAVLLALYYSSRVACGSGEPRPAFIDADKLRERLLASCETIKSLCIEYEARGYRAASVPEGAYLHRVIAVKAPCFYYHRSTHGHARMGWQDDPFQQVAYITASKNYHVFPNSRAYRESAITPQEGVPGTLPQEIYFLATGIWPLQRPAPRPNDRPYMLIELAKSTEPIAIARKQERVRGRWCHVIMNGKSDKLWLDLERSCALVRRETANDAGHLISRFDLREHKEVRDGVWLPQAIHNVQFDYDAPTAAGRMRRVVDATIRIVNMSVNDVDDDRFDYIPEPAALRLGSGDEIAVQTMPGGLDHLDDVADWIKTYNPAQELDSTAPVSFWGLALAAAGCALLLLNYLHSRANRAA